MKFIIQLATVLSFVVLNSVSMNAQQGTYRIAYDATTQKYTVYGKVSVAYNKPLSRFVNVFVTVVVPHSTGATKFTPTAISTDAALSATNVVTVTRYDAPSENTSKDYLFFNFDVGNSAYTPANIIAGTEFPIFSFQNSGTCNGDINIMNMTGDPFHTPNVESINAGQAFSVLGAGKDIYAGIYGAATAACATPCAANAGTLSY